ncbi:hypothetical protein ACFXKI_39965 [Streptomyces mirabilis]
MGERLKQLPVVHGELVDGADVVVDIGPQLRQLCGALLATATNPA